MLGSSRYLSMALREATLRPHCGFIAHSFWMSSNYSRALVQLPPSMVIRPYISPSISAFCSASPSKSGVASPLILVDSDTSSAVRWELERACNTSVCEVKRVIRVPRSQVLQLLARASIVVDWCMVGSERLPIEATLCGAVLLTS